MMKKTTLFKLSFLLIAAIAMVITGCKKDDTTVDPPTNGSTTVQQISQDDNEIQQIDDDINLDIEIMLTGSGLKSINWLPCNATIDSTNVVNDSITYYITYHGLNCPETLYRTGQVEVKKKVGTHWYSEGATVLVKIINLHVTKVATQKTKIINGVKTRKNVTGGLLVQLGYGVNHIVHRTWGFITVNFENGTNRTWNIARKRTYSGSIGQLVIGVDGFGKVGEYKDLVTWGVSRNGHQFYISTPQPVRYRQNCDFKPVKGVQTISIPSRDKGATLTFGYDDDNQPIIPPACPTKYKIDWYHGSNSGTIFIWL